MTLKQILIFDVNRTLFWNVGAALTQPITNPLIKAACGYVIGIMVFGLGSMLIGVGPGDGVIAVLSVGSAVLFALTPNRPPLPPGEDANTPEGPPV